MFWIEYIIDLLVLSVQLSQLSSSQLSQLSAHLLRLSVLHVEMHFVSHFVSHFGMYGGHTLPIGQIIPPTQLVPAVQLLPVGHSELVMHPLHEGQ